MKISVFCKNREVCLGRVSLTDSLSHSVTVAAACLSQPSFPETSSTDQVNLKNVLKSICNVHVFDLVWSDWCLQTMVGPSIWTVVESLQLVLEAAVDCSLILSSPLLIDSRVFVHSNLCYSSLCSHSFVSFHLLCFSGENVTNCNMKCSGLLFSQHDNRRFWKWPRGVVLLLRMTHKAKRGHDIKTTH